MPRVRVVLFALLLTGCGLFAPPHWVSVHPLLDAGFVYGVGECGATDDGETRSAEVVATARALDELAWQLRSQAAQRIGPPSPREPLVLPALVAGELDGAEVVEVWVDTYGDTGRDDRTFVLVRLPLSRLDALVARLGGARGTAPEVVEPAAPVDVSEPAPEDSSLEGTDPETSEAGAIDG